MQTSAHLVLALSLLSSAAAAEQPVVRHDARALLVLDEGRLRLEDRLTLPEGLTNAAGAVPLVVPATDTVEITQGKLLSREPLDEHRQALHVVPEQGEVALVYEARIAEAPTPMAEEHARSFSESRGIISREGVYLSPESAWLPRVGPELVAVTLEVSGLPAEWSLVSESQPVGDATSTRRLEPAHPTDMLHLVAGPWTRTSAKVGDVILETVLRTPDPALTQRYLEVGRQYLRMYEDLLGPYPWPRFSVVENFWETGYGMSSFTLLGPKVIRFPFLLHSSFPHELLHNWWGNGVYVDEGGNWSEGLTAYLADHLVQEQRGRGEAYRRDALVRYADYVREEADFPLRSFGSRHSRASEAVGYGKWMMVAHMLRRELGDEVFRDGLRDFFARHKYTRGSFDDLRASFERVSGRSLEGFFAAWTERPGAPTLGWSEVRASRVGTKGPWQLEVSVVQKQAGESFPLTVPVAVALADGSTRYTSARFEGGKEREVARAVLTAPAEPLRVQVDPHFDVFRSLHEAEVAPTLSRALGGEKMLFVLPTLASDAEREAWRGLVEKVCGAPSERCRVAMDTDTSTLPDDAAVWVLGYGNHLRGAAILGAQRMGAHLDDGTFRVAGQTQENATNSLALAFAHPRAPRSGLAFVAADRVSAIPGLARKLPHYGKYGYLGFQGEEPDNVLKGTWEAAESPLLAAVRPGGESARFSLEERSALASLPPPFDESALLSWVQELAKPTYEGRGYGSDGLARAFAAVRQELEGAGFGSAVGERCFDDPEGPGNKTVRACNLVATLEGRDPSLPAIIVGAHLDHLGRGWPEAAAGNAGKIHPGANDNASGVSVLLAVARKMKADGPRARTIHFVSFTGEEAGLRGSRRFVKELGGDPSARVAAMVNLDTVGRRLGAPFLVAGHESAREWVHAFMGVGFVTGVESRMAAEGLSASDHEAFLEVGIPAVHIFAGPAPGWHSPADVAEDVEPRTLVDAAVLTHELVAWLADRTEPLTAQGARASSSSSQGGSSSPRRVSLGTVPDMSYGGPGVRITGVTPGSPAERAGLQEGDVVLRLGERAVNDLRGLAAALREAKAGERVPLRIRRGSEELVVEVELAER